MLCIYNRPQDRTGGEELRWPLLIKHVYHRQTQLLDGPLARRIGKHAGPAGLDKRSNGLLAFLAQPAHILRRIRSRPDTMSYDLCPDGREDNRVEFFPQISAPYALVTDGLI